MWCTHFLDHSVVFFVFFLFKMQKIFRLIWLVVAVVVGLVGGGSGGGIYGNVFITYGKTIKRIPRNAEMLSK